MDTLHALADRFDPPPIDVFGILGYTPSPRQVVFHDATDFDVLYGGAAGGGKTKALLMEGIRAAIRYPGLRIGAFRRTFDELAESFFKELALVDYARALDARWNGTDRQLTFPNGSVIRFRYLETVQDATRRQGGEYQLVLLDERTLIPPDAVSILVDERIRTGSIDLPVIGVRSGTNPGGPGHGACRDRYIVPTDYGEHGYTDDSGRTVRFIPAKVTDNPHILRADPGYLKRLDSIPDAARRAAMRDGSWDSFAGQVFDEWNRDRHIVPRFTIPAEWRRLAGIDWGFAAPWAVIWAAVDPDGRVWAYRERYEKQVGETDQAHRILDDEHGEGLDRGIQRFADPSMWRTTGEGLTIAERYAVEGVPLEPANNERIAGWQRVHTYLADGPACLHHRELGWPTCPMLHVLDATCPNLVRTLPSLPYDRLKVEDVDTGAEDHAPDAFRYLLMGIGGTGPKFVFAHKQPRALDGRPLGVPLGPTIAVPPPADTGPRFKVGKADRPDGNLPAPPGVSSSDLRETAPITERAPARAGQPIIVGRRGIESDIPTGGTTIRQQSVSATVSRKEEMDQLYGAYLACPWSSACVDQIARTITAGGIEIVPDDETVERLVKPPTPPKQVLDLQRLLDYVNPKEDIRQLMRGVLTDLEVFADSFVEVVWMLGQPAALYSLDSPTMVPVADEHGTILSYEQVVEPGRVITFDPHEVIHVSFDSLRGGVYGTSPTKKLIVPITNWLFTEGLLKETMRKGNPPDLHVDWPTGTAPSTVERFREQYQAQQLGIPNVGNPVTTIGGAKVAEMKVSAIAEYAAILTMERDTIVSGYGVLKRKVGISESGSLGGAGAEVGEDRTFALNTCQPTGELVLEKYNFHLLDAFGITGWKQRFGDVDWRSDEVADNMRDQRIRNGTYTINRARSEVGEPAVDGGDVPVLVDRQNMIAVPDLPAYSKANLAAVQAQGAQPAAPAGQGPAQQNTGPAPAANTKPAKPAKGPEQESASLDAALAREFQQRRRKALKDLAEADRAS